MKDDLLIAFLQGVGTDVRGRRHSDILNFSDEELENEHDYIQWLFPLREPSQAVPESPYLDDNDVIRFLQHDKQVHENTHKALLRMQKFYLENDHWLQQNNHNHLRITRILKSIVLLHSTVSAVYFYEFIIRRVEAAQPVTDETLEFWKKGLKGQGPV